jgi:tRNA-2-methylthio-N6-dimethylallyladenosine synthase
MKIFIETYGCQMNVSDSELIKRILMENNEEITDDIDEADVLLFNTCSVRQHAEDRVLGRISNEASRKIKKRNLKIGVIGCMAQRLGSKLHAINKNIDFVIGVDQYKNIPKIIRQKKISDITEVKINNYEVYENIYPIHSGKFNAFITIMRGCDNFCTYCIVPYTRGRERSRNADEIINEIKIAASNGFKDITLLGQNVNSYKFNDINFASLLKKASNIDSIKRLRFVTSHPKDLSDEVIEVMGNSDKICKHLHLPLQSGNTDILKRMNRGYTYEHYRNIIKKLRKKMPNIAITTDIIVGFPGEKESQFFDTYNAMNDIKFDYAFTFKYSPREGTIAAKFTDQIPEDIRLMRLKKLIKLQEKITLNKYQAKIGSIQELYVEKVSKKSEKELAGKTDDFKITVFRGSKDLIGKFVKVKIVDAIGWTLKGELIE